MVGPQDKGTLLVDMKVVRMLHLHREEFQVFAAYVLIGREEVKAVIWPPGYVTTSRVAEVGFTQATWPKHADPDQGGKSYSCQSQGKIIRV